MEIPIRRIDQNLPLPEYKTAGAAAMDCYVREGAVIPPHGIGYVALNFSLKPPRGHFMLMAARSSMHKQGLMLANGIGIFDEDFSGDNDEYKVILHNFSDVPVEVKRGDRIVQIMALPFDRVSWREVPTTGEADRGGIGSTGIR